MSQATRKSMSGGIKRKVILKLIDRKKYPPTDDHPSYRLPPYIYIKLTIIHMHSDGITV